MNRAFLAGAIAALLACGCALTSKAELVGTRYFTPESPRPRLTATSSPRPASEISVRLGRVSAGAHIRERIAYHDAAYEVGYYEDQQWTERPEVYVRRKLAQTLFETHGFSHALGGAAPTLDVEVVAFDEIRAASGRSARVELRATLYADRVVLHEETISIDRAVPVRPGKPRIEDVVAAMADALDAATELIAVRIAAAKLPGSNAAAEYRRSSFGAEW